MYHIGVVFVCIEMVYSGPGITWARVGGCECSSGTCGTVSLSDFFYKTGFSAHDVTRYPSNNRKSIWPTFIRSARPLSGHSKVGLFSSIYSCYAP